MFPVHPHPRGDNVVRSILAASAAGSPPPAWGQRTPAMPKPPTNRFTPTRVGTTPSLVAAPFMTTVHPHPRGDNTARLYPARELDGSPPPAWGQPSRRLYRDIYTRFTPTRVGTTVSPPSTAFMFSVHPHPRGDNMKVRNKTTRNFGSPPPAWGQRAKAVGVSDTQRFTPTRVGTTSNPAVWTLHLTVHPHPRGDNDYCPDLAHTSAVHPHPRGDNTTPVLLYAACIGSPPPAWGQQSDTVELHFLKRFTPTRVGTTILR